jgi:hypothetical protein
MFNPFDEAAAIDDIQFVPLARADWEIPNIAHQDARPLDFGPFDWGFDFQAAEIPRGFADAFADFDFEIPAPFLSDPGQTEQERTYAMPSGVPIRPPSPPRTPVILKPFSTIHAAELCVSALKKILLQRSEEWRLRELPTTEGVPAN